MTGVLRDTGLTKFECAPGGGCPAGLEDGSISHVNYLRRRMLARWICEEATSHGIGNRNASNPLVLIPEIR